VNRLPGTAKIISISLPFSTMTKFPTGWKLGAILSCSVPVPSSFSPLIQIRPNIGPDFDWDRNRWPVQSDLIRCVGWWVRLSRNTIYPGARLSMKIPAGRGNRTRLSSQLPMQNLASKILQQWQQAEGASRPAPSSTFNMMALPPCFCTSRGEHRPRSEALARPLRMDRERFT
jgi:hypothetical protein